MVRNTRPLTVSSWKKHKKVAIKHYLMLVSHKIKQRPKTTWGIVETWELHLLFDKLTKNNETWYISSLYHPSSLLHMWRPATVSDYKTLQLFRCLFCEKNRYFHERGWRSCQIMLRIFGAEKASPKNTSLFGHPWKQWKQSPTPVN